MRKTKIEWCDVTVNPVIGCKNHCPYCYARRLNDRFKFIPNWNAPQFFPERLKEFKSKKPKSIFINSMSDIAFWKQEWFDIVIEAIKENPQHNYIALTKHPNLVNELTKKKAIKHISNLFVGLTVTTQADMGKLLWGIRWLSIEPILEPIDIRMPEISDIDLIIIGAETGNRAGKVIPEKKWIDDIVRQADERGIRVFMKNSLKAIMGDDFRQDKLIWEE